MGTGWAGRRRMGSGSEEGPDFGFPIFSIQPFPIPPAFPSGNLAVCYMPVNIGDY
jgi:hypothetical protein